MVESPSQCSIEVRYRMGLLHHCYCREWYINAAIHGAIACKASRSLIPAWTRCEIIINFHGNPLTKGQFCSIVGVVV
jgi:hypothetical protein